MKRKTAIILVAALCLAGEIFAQPLTRIDWKWHDVGNVRQLITNVGYTGNSSRLGLPIPFSKPYCEFPIGSGNAYTSGEESGQEHLIGGIVNGNVAVSSSGHDPDYEFFSTDSLWDSIWVVRKGETLDIGDPKAPYLSNYTAISDQDFVCKYGDFRGELLPRVEPHRFPLGIDIIQTSHAWATTPFDEWIFYQYTLIAKKHVENVWIGYFFQSQGISKGPLNGRDDCSKYIEDLHLGMVWDQIGQGGDDGPPGPIGFMVIPPENIDPDALTWTFENGEDIPDRPDAGLYEILSSGEIDPPSCDASSFRGWQMIVISFGPLTLSPGDTLKYGVLQILGTSEQDVLDKIERFNWFKSLGFQSPGPPPPPPLRVTIGNHRVNLNWEAQPGDENPETWLDENRPDNGIESQPFEGYRVYKSTESINGPWTLLAEFDIPGNPYNNNTGLVREYIDVGLVNNLEYYYTVTSFSKPDTVGLLLPVESSLSANAVAVTPGTALPETVTDQIAVVPNPYRGDIAYRNFKPSWEPVPPGRRWTERDRRLQFINVPSPSEIKIYTLAGDLVDTIPHSDPNRGFADWNITSSVDQAISSGIYLFTVKDLKTGKVHVGKFVVIK